MAEGINNSQKSSFENLSIPVIITSIDDEIIWENDASKDAFKSFGHLCGKTIAEFLGKDLLENRLGTDVSIDGSRYTAFVTDGIDGDNKIKIYYFINDTQFKEKSEKYDSTRPVVMMMTIDSYDEALQDYKENERAQLLSQVEYHIEKFVGESDGIVIKSDRD